MFERFNFLALQFASVFQFGVPFEKFETTDFIYFRTKICKTCKTRKLKKKGSAYVH